MILVVVIAGCDTSVGVPESGASDRTCSQSPAGSDIFPLSKGNTWTYEFQAGEFSQPPFRVRDTLFVDLNESVFMSGFDGPVLSRREYFSTPPAWGRLYGYKGTNMYVAGVLDGTRRLRLESKRYEYPATVGDTYPWIPAISFQGGWSYSDTLSISVIAVDTTIVTRAGTFSAVGYRYLEPPPDGASLGKIVTEYVAPGVGVVLVTRRGETGLQLITSRFELIEYCLFRE